MSLTVPQIAALLQPADRSKAALRRLHKALPTPAIIAVALSAPQTQQLQQLSADLHKLHGPARMRAFNRVSVL